MTLLKTFALILGTLPFGASSANAADVRFRGNAEVGSWFSSFEQSDGSRSMKQPSYLAPALQFGLGIGVDRFFVEHTFVFHLPQHLFREGGTRPRDAVYFSFLGAQVGARIPVLPLEASLGLEKGNYRFSSGSGTRYGGLTLKLGVAWLFPAEWVALKAEYRRMSLGSDDAGPLPEGLGGTVTSGFLGVSFGFR